MQASIAELTTAEGDRELLAALLSRLVDTLTATPVG
jgi:hypothetical protein